jgi:hypothetical protein
MNKKDGKEIMKKSITNLAYDQDGFIVGVKGKLTARELQYAVCRKDVLEELNIRRVD